MDDSHHCSMYYSHLFKKNHFKIHFIISESRHKYDFVKCYKNLKIFSCSTRQKLRYRSEQATGVHVHFYMVNQKTYNIIFRILLSEFYDVWRRKMIFVQIRMKLVCANYLAVNWKRPSLWSNWQRILHSYAIAFLHSYI